MDPVAVREDDHPALRQAINAACAAEPGDLLLFQFGKESVVHTVMANLRVHLAKRMGLIPEYGSGGKWRFLWVVNPPLFEFDEDSASGPRRTTRSRARTTPTCSTSRPTRVG